MINVDQKTIQNVPRAQLTLALPWNFKQNNNNENTTKKIDEV